MSNLISFLCLLLLSTVCLSSTGAANDWQFAGSKKRGWINRYQTDVYIDMETVKIEENIVVFDVLQDRAKVPDKDKRRFFSMVSREMVNCQPAQDGRFWWKEMSHTSFFTGNMANGKRQQIDTMSPGKHWMQKLGSNNLIRFEFVCKNIAGFRY